MPVTANAKCTEIVVGQLAKFSARKRSRLVWKTRLGMESNSNKTALQVTCPASGRESQAEIIQRACEGDQTAFECLYRSHCKRVYAVCLRMVGDMTEAEDLTQEAFLLLFRKIHVPWGIGILHLAAQIGGQHGAHAPAQEVVTCSLDGNGSRSGW